MRFTPNLKISARPLPSTFLFAGYDTLEESASVYIFDATWQWLEAAKENARRKNRGDNQAYTTVLGGVEFQIKPHGGDGVAFILSNDLFTVAIRPAEVDFNLSVKYSAACLCQYGPQEARRMLWAILMQEMKPRHLGGRENEDQLPIWQRISRADFAFDFHSPAFSAEIGPEMVRRMVCHSSVKVRSDLKVRNQYGDEVDCYTMGTSIRTQTLTIGIKSSLQIQIYNKTDEITEKSQKTWMYKLWQRAGLERDDDGKYSHVWRLEVRFLREFLAERNIDTFEDLEHYREQLLSEALSSRRLTDPSDDTNRRRWPVHPLWGKALQISGQREEMRPLGRTSERAGDAVKREAVMVMASAIRRLSVLDCGDWDEGTAESMFKEVMASIYNDKHHDDAIEKYQERYKFLNCSR